MKKGFTLIELVLYIALVGMILTTALTFTWTIIQDQNKQASLSEAYYNFSFAAEKISYYLERASSLEGTTIYNSHPGKLVINYPNIDQVTVDSYEKIITQGDNDITIRKLRFTQGATIEDLTSDQINVTDFTLNNISLPKADTIQVNLSLEHINPSNSKQYEGKFSQSFSVTLKQQ